MRLKLQTGGHYKPKADDPVFCEEHNVEVRWGDLDGIQQLAVSEGLDIAGPRCILESRPPVKR